MSKRLFINDQQADLSDDPIAVNWEYLNLQKLEARFQPFSSSLRLPFTDRNKRIFSYGDAPGTDLTNVRGTQNSSLWFDGMPVVKAGTIQVQSMNNENYISNINGNNSLIDAIKTNTVEDLMDENIGFELSPPASSWAAVLSQLATGGNGIMLARDLYDTISSSTWDIYTSVSPYIEHWVWFSLNNLLTQIESLQSCSFKVAEGGSIVNLSASSIKSTYLDDTYMPGFTYYVDYDTPNTTWEVFKNNSTGIRFQFGSDLMTRDNFVIGGDRNAWELVKIIARWLCMGIDVDVENSEITFFPLNEMDTFNTNVLDLSDKFVSAVKIPYVPSYEAMSYIRYKATDNIPETYNQIEITSEKEPALEKTLFTFNLMVPGLYYNTTIGDSLFLLNYLTNQEMAKTPLFLYANGDVVSTTVTHIGNGGVSAVEDLEKLRLLDTSPMFADLKSWVEIGETYNAEVSLNLYDYLRLLPYKFIKVSQIGTTFYINKISSFNPYSDRPTKIQLIKVS